MTGLDKGRRRSSLLHRRRKKRAHAALFISIIFVSGAFWVLRSGVFRVQEVVVSETDTVKEKDVEALVKDELGGSYFYIVPKDNIFFFSRSRIKEALFRKYPVIKSSEVSLSLPRSVAISIVERRANALWCGDIECYLLDDGFAFGKGSASSSTLPIMKGGSGTTTNVLGKTIFNPEDVGTVRSVVSFLEKERVPVEYTTVSSDTGDYAFVTKEGATILMNKKQDIEEIFQNMESIFSSEDFLGKNKIENQLASLLYIDLRFGKKVFYKFKEGE